MSAARRFSLLPRMAPKSKAHIGVGLVLIFLASGVTTMLILPPDVSSRNLPAIDAGDQNLPRQTERALSAFVAANDPPFLYRHGNQPVRVETVNGEHPVTRPLSTDMTVHHMARSAQWYRQYASGNRRPARPPIVVARDILASPNLPLPCLERIVRVPFLGRDGNLKTEPGYHEGDATLFVPPRGFRLPKISDNPTPGQLEVARRLILRSLLRDFPFTSEAARAHAVAALLLPLVRSFIRGPTPLHLVEKPTPGTGGTLLVQVLCQISLGETIAAMSAPKDESEWRRTVLASLRSVPLAVFIDNPQQLESPTLASAITSDIYTDRVVRTSETVRLPVSCLWIASANNPVLSREMARRVIRIRLDAGVERPELRDSFLHPQLKAWAKKNHHLLLWAALTFVQAWVAAGHPRASKVFGMFEDWVEVNGRHSAGCRDPWVSRKHGCIGQLCQRRRQPAALSKSLVRRIRQ